jgi:drug/metabolite transporter (DMT)-like permease
LNARRQRDPGGGWRLALAVGAASFSGPLLRYAGPPALVAASGRMLFATLLALPGAIGLWRRAGWRALGIDRAVAGPMLVATAMLALHFATWTAGVDLTTVTSAVVLANAHPILVLAVEALVWRQRVHRRQWAGAFVALAGIALLAGLDGRWLGGRAVEGDLLALAGAVTYGVYVLASARVRTQVPTAVQACVLYLGSLAALGLATLALGEPWPSVANRPLVWLAFVLLAVIPTTLGHTMVQSILDRIRPGVISLALLGEPVGASVLAWALVHQRPAPFDVAGGALTLAGIALALWPQGEPPAATLAT